MTIQCNNPNCNATIDVPQGAGQVICPTCNTWHFPPTDESQDNSSFGNDYMPPPPPSPVQDNSSSSPSYGLPDYDAYSPPVESQSTPTTDLNAESAEEKNDTPGLLVSLDGREFPLKLGKNTIGRKGTDILLEDKTVSRRHCVIEVTPHPAGGTWEYTLYDIGHLDGAPSTNGVFVSGRSLRLQDHERIPIGNGSTVRIGKATLVLKCIL